MPLVIPQTLLPDPPDFFERALTAEVLGGYFQVTGNPAEVVFLYGRHGLGQKTEAQVVPVGSYNVGRSPDGAPLAGIRARNATAGVASVLAGYFWTASDPTLSFVGVPSGAGLGVNSCRIYRTSDQGFGSGSTTISFDAERWDVGGLHSGVNPTRITIPAGGEGKYLLGAQANCLFTSGGPGTIFIIRNGTQTLAAAYDRNDAADATWPRRLAIVTLWDCLVGDYFEVVVNTPVGSGTIQVAADYSPEFWATRLP